MDSFLVKICPDYCPKQLLKMLPSERLHLQTRLCAFCYADVPVHQASWQQAEVDRCDRHVFRFISECPNCGSGFRTPALWEEAGCDQCGLEFANMQIYQQLR
jgi:uncharacterized protein with PIN domain